MFFPIIFLPPHKLTIQADTISVLQIVLCQCGIVLRWGNHADLIQKYIHVILVVCMY
jgi:hypothetical protein